MPRGVRTSVTTFGPDPEPGKCIWYIVAPVRPRVEIIDLDSEDYCDVDPADLDAEAASGEPSLVDLFGAPDPELDDLKHLGDAG